MTKIMLVEDDKSLREIYGVRLLAEGYDIVSAGDGEEALAMAIKERPNLIISDVMMPKISGFDMLDILRSTTETRDIKVIMMTALSSEEQRARGQSLGADRYLVKSQVGIEDVVAVVHEVMNDRQAPVAPATEAAPTVAPQPPATQQPATPIAPAPVAAPVAPAPITTPEPATTPPAPVAAPSAPSASGFTFQSPQPTTAPTNIPQPSVASGDTPAGQKLGGGRIIQPLNDPSNAPVDINDLLDKELAMEAGVNENERPAIATVDQEKAIIDSQINQFAQTPPPPAPVAPAASDDVPEVTISEDGTVQPQPQPSLEPEVEATPAPQQPSQPQQATPAANPPQTPPLPPAPTA